MPEKRNRKKATGYPHEERWLREFVGYHGNNCAVRFSDADLGGVSWVRIVEALSCGTVISAEKCDGPGTICMVEYHVEYRAEEGEVISVKVWFVSNEELLSVLSAESRKESESEPDHAA